MHDPHARHRLGDDRRRWRPGRAARPRATRRPASRSDLAAADPSTSTFPSAASSAARVRDSPSMRASAASTRSPARPSGTGSARVSPGRAGSRPTAVVGAVALGVVDGTPRSVSSTMNAPAQVIALSATLKTSVTGESRKSIDVSLERPGRAEDPVDQVADRAAEQQAERDRPAAGWSAALGEPHDHDGRRPAPSRSARS